VRHSAASLALRAALRPRRRPDAPVWTVNELPAWPPLRRLGEEMHHLVEHERHLLVDRDAEATELLDAEGVIVCYLTGRERGRDALGIGLAVVFEQELLERRLHLAQRLLGEITEDQRLIVSVGVRLREGLQDR